VFSAQVVAKILHPENTSIEHDSISKNLYRGMKSFPAQKSNNWIISESSP